MKAASDKDLTMDSPELEQELGSELYERLVDDIELSNEDGVYSFEFENQKMETPKTRR